MSQAWQQFKPCTEKNRYGAVMDPDRARELLEAERVRIERALARVQPEDDSEPAGKGPYDDFRTLSSFHRRIELLFAAPLPLGETSGLDPRSMPPELIRQELWL